MTDNRCYPRFDAKDIVRITLVTEHEEAGLPEDVIYSVSKDISASGIRFSTLAPPAIGALMNLTVIVSKPFRPIRDLVGRVAWVMKDLHGLRHTVGVDLSESPVSALEEWHALVEEKSPQSDATHAGVVV